MGSVRVLACLILVAGVASAAPVPTPPKSANEEAPLTAAKLLKHRKVQKELKLAAEQRIAIVDGLADIDEAIDKKRNALLKAPMANNPNTNVFEKLEKEQQEGHEKVLKTTAAKLLTPAQRTRLNQIDRQI